LSETSSRMQKKRLRVASLQKRRSIRPEDLARASALVEANLLSLREYKAAELIISYCAKDDEVQTRSIIENALAQGKRVAVILTDVVSGRLRFSEIASFDELAPGPFGILEPKPGRLHPVLLEEADLILVPLVAWDERGQRLGYGQGYFDRALAGGKRIKKIGLALESQRLPRVPNSKHDIPLDVVVTEKRVMRPRRVAAKQLSST
jgi:5-formyltetrahydrofolate cyclo-ligase